ncbi:hypothetical protein [Vibrio anguillarum]|uniref:hypothetical protein n=1 Tax=Vibrio anguillarum TaxID=55601 RepID=UPI003CF741AB
MSYNRIKQQSHRKYRKHFQNHQNEGLVLYDFNEIIPDRIEEFTFIKQLIDIGDISESDNDEIVEFATYMISAKKNLNSWLENGELTNMQLNNEVTIYIRMEKQMAENIPWRTQ